MNDPLERVEEAIRQTAAVSERVFISNHAEERMIERQVTLPQVLHCLRSGTFIEGPTLDSYKQIGYKATMQQICAGDLVQVALKLIEQDQGHIIVITVI
jgi:hypothetical protein